MKIVIPKRVDLSFLGEVWAGCYLDFKSPNLGEVKEYVKDDVKPEEVLEFLKKMFLGGVVYDGKQTTAIKSDELEDLPVELFPHCLTAITGTGSEEDKKKEIVA